MVADKDRKEECGVYSSSSVVGLLQYVHSPDLKFAVTQEE